MPKGMVIPTVGVKGEFPVVGAPVFGGEAYNQALKPLENASNQWLEWDQEKKRVQDRIDTANIKAYLTIAKGEFEQSIAEEPDYQKYPDMVRSYKDRLTETIGTMSGSEFVKKSVAPFVDLHASQGALYARAYGRTQWIKDEEAKTVTASDMMAKTAVNESYMMGDWTFQTPTPTKEDHSNYVSLQRQSGVLTPGKDRELNDAFDKSVRNGVADRLIREDPIKAQEVFKNTENFPGMTDEDRNKNIREARVMASTMSTQAEKDISQILADVKLKGKIPSLSDVPPDKWKELVALDPQKANQMIDHINTIKRMDEDRTDRELARQDRREDKAIRDQERQERIEERTMWNMNLRNLITNRDQLLKVDLNLMFAKNELGKSQYDYLVSHKKEIEEGKDNPVRYAQMKDVLRDLERDFSKNKVFGDPKDPKNQDKLNEVTDALRAWTVNPDNKDKKPSDFYKEVMQPYKSKWLGWILDGTIDPNKRLKEQKEKKPTAAPTTQAAFNPEGTDYDMEGAKRAGITPDATGHWASRDPKTGLILKGRGHETFWKTEQAEKEIGNIIFRKADGRYYSLPKAEARDAWIKDAKPINKGQSDEALGQHFDQKYGSQTIQTNGNDKDATNKLIEDYRKTHGGKAPDMYQLRKLKIKAGLVKPMPGE